MRTFALTALLALAMVAPGLGQGCGGAVDAGLAGGNGQSGNMFDLVDLNGGIGLTISDIEIHTPSTGMVPVEVYIIPTGGTYVGNENNAAAWTLVGSAMVQGNGLNAYTQTGISFALPAGVGTVPMYVTIADPNVVDIVQYTNGTAVGGVWAADAFLQINEGSGIQYPFLGNFQPRNFNGRISYSFAGGSADYQTNSPAANLTIDGTASSDCVAGIVTKTLNSACGGAAVGDDTATIRFGSTSVGLPYDIAYNSSPIVPLSGGGFSFAPEILNLDILGGLTFAIGGLAINTNPLPGLPGTTSTQFTFNLTGIAPGTTLSAQALAVDPTSPIGIKLSSAAQLDVVLTTGALPGPTGDDTSVDVDLVASGCLPGGVQMYGTQYNNLFVASNGRVNFVAADDDFTASPATALLDNPFVGLWSDLSPNVGGSIDITFPSANTVRVDYNAVPFFGVTETATYGIEFDGVTGIITIDGLAGVQPQVSGTVNAMMLGISPGIAAAGGVATDPGPVVFGTPTGLTGGAAAPTDMLYDFDSTLGALPTVTDHVTFGLTGTVIFTPDGNGNYTWQAL